MSEPAELIYAREPLSRRRRVLGRVWKWTWRGTAALVALMLLVHTAWLVVVTVRLNRAIAALAAAGEPTSPATLQPPVPPGRNAYPDLVAAARVAARYTAQLARVDALEDTPHPPMFDIERRRLQAYVADCSAALPLADGVDGAPANVITEKMVSPILNQQLPQLTEFRMLAYLQAYRAQLAHDAGDDAAALAHLARHEAIAVATASHPSLVGMLVGTGIRTMQADQLTGLAPVLRIGDGPGAARPEQVRRTITGLLDNAATDAELLTAFRGERVMQIDSLESIDNGTLGNVLTPGRRTASSVMRFGIRPYLRSNELTCVRVTTDVIRNMTAPDWPTARAQLTAVRPAGRVSGPFELLAKILMPSFERAVMAGYRIRTDRALAAVTLATRWCTVETGKPPAGWNDLVPRYLPAVPLDPIAASAPLHARFGGADPIVWSLGANGVDDGGSEHSRRGIATDWDCDDRVTHLAARPRVATAELQRQIDLDFDSPVAATRLPPATTPAATTPPAADRFYPDWDDITALTAWPDAGGIPALSTRRDVYAALRNATDTPDADAAPPATQPTPPPPGGAIRGVAMFGSDRLGFTLHADGTLELIGPDGVVVRQSWTPSAWHTGDRAFWR